MSNKIFVEATTGDYFKDIIIKSVALSKNEKCLVEVSFMDEKYLVSPKDTYDDIMLEHRNRNLLILGAYRIKLEQDTVDFIIEEILANGSSLDILLKNLDGYCRLTCSTISETRRWKVIDFFSRIDIKPNYKNIRVCPQQMMTPELLIGYILGTLIKHDYNNDSTSLIAEFKANPNYTNLATSFDRKKTIDQILKEI